MRAALLLGLIALTASAFAQPAPTFNWPARGRLSSCFGPRWERIHVGIDIAVAEGSPVLAARDGRVIFSGFVPGYGNLIVLEHEGGWYTAYGHNQRNLVEGPTGDGRSLVLAGQAIAIAGHTGNATGPHVHFEIRRNTDALDPLALLPRE